MRVNYASYISSTAETVQFLIGFRMGDSNSTPPFFVKVSNFYDVHYNKVYGHGNSNVWIFFSESFQFFVDKDKSLLVEVEKSLSGTNHGFSLYVVSYRE